MVKPNGKIMNKISQKIEPNKVLPVSALPEDINASMWMHSVTYKTENLRKINYTQTEGISYTDQEWIFLPMSTVKKIYYWPNILYKYLVGRDGQTISAESYAKNIWMEIRGVKVMIEEYEKYKLSFLPENQKYLSSQLIKRTGNIYQFFLFSFKKVLKQNELVDFDNYLKNTSSFVYEKTGDLLTYGRIRFKFIQEWRNGQTDKTFKFCVYRLASGIFKISLFPFRFAKRILINKSRITK